MRFESKLHAFYTLKTNMTSLLPNWQQEIIDLHQFFQDWFQGTLPKIQSAFSRFEDVLHPQFHLISPQGKSLSKRYLTKQLFSAFGTSPTVKIWIENPQLHIQTEQFAIATYHELQSTDTTPPTTRISTVTFAPNSFAPNQLHWLHVHETWLA